MVSCFTESFKRNAHFWVGRKEVGFRVLLEALIEITLLGWQEGGWVSRFTRSFKRIAHVWVGLRGVGFAVLRDALNGMCTFGLARGKLGFVFYEKLSAKYALLGWLEGGWVSSFPKSFKRNTHFWVG